MLSPPPGSPSTEGVARLPVDDRIDTVRIIDALSRRTEEMAQTISSENGSPIGFSVGAPIDVMRSMIDVATETRWEERQTGRYLDYLVRREAVGVVGAIATWNNPQVLFATELAPCHPGSADPHD